MDLPDPPEGWRLKSLIEADGTWRAFLYSSSEWVCAGGTSPRYALLDAIKRIEEGAVQVNMTGGKRRSETIDIVSVLGIAKPTFIRRA